MKSSEFKKIVKSAVKEAIQEELKDILFEAFKSQTNTSQITENKSNIGNPIDYSSINSSPSPSFLIIFTTPSKINGMWVISSPILIIISPCFNLSKCPTLTISSSKSCSKISE